MRASIADYCAAIGADPLLVQGAGGNVSWKDGETLWVKASGTWLADAARKDLFVPVDLPHLQASIARADFGVTPRPLPPLLPPAQALKPSIETLLHAVMPHPVVVHLHAVEILARLVRRGFEADLTALLNASLRWTQVEYLKPGAALAGAVRTALNRTPGADIVFLQNHGVLLGGRDIAEIDSLLRALIDALKVPAREPPGRDSPAAPLSLNGESPYIPVSDRDVHQLAVDPVLFDRLESDWALYPDHVVFLGAGARRYEHIDALAMELSRGSTGPELAFIRGAGVFTRAGFNAGKQAQLRCYYDVLSRQPEGCVLSSLSDHQIAELLNWDAERYRMQMGLKAR